MKFSKKIQNLRSLIPIIRKLRTKGKKIVFTNGCFDIIHPGHIKVLKEAKKKGDVLIVAINSDKSVRSIKDKNRPILNQNARKTIVSSFEEVDYVILFKESTPLKLIKDIKPDVLVKGGDWGKNNIVGKDIVKKVVRVKPLKNYSSTSIINKIIRLYNS